MVSLSSKQRVFLMILISQIIFIGISSLVILNQNKIVAIVIINILFAIFVAFIAFSLTKGVSKATHSIKLYLDDIMDFMFYKTNSIQKREYTNVHQIDELIDELSLYAKKVDEFRKKDMHVLGEVVIALNKLTQGIYTTQVHSDSDNFMIQTLKKIVNQMLMTSNVNMEKLVDIVGSYSNHDYRKQMEIDDILKGKMRLTMERINFLGQELNKNATSNLQNGHQLESNSLSMKQSVESLSQKANEQAASLEETAAALEEITSITQNNTNNANEMANLSTRVKQSINEGEKLANQTNTSMDEINNKVAEINQAVEIVDQIAFQTNILSLNAAVEAATAGEAGKGFAVVAQEVRNLASRSAEAAKEIKDLVENATEETNNGKKNSDDMIEGYKNLNEIITKTVDIIQDVSVASQEQLKGIEQINSSMSLLDKVTQENAIETNNVSEIANDTLQMAQILVQEAEIKKISEG